MSTKKDLTDLLSYAVKSAEAKAEVKMAWAELDPLERALIQVGERSRKPVNLTGVRKVAALLTNKKAMCGTKHKAKGKKKAKMYKKGEAKSTMVELLKKANLAKVAVTTPLGVPTGATPGPGFGAMGAPAAAGAGAAGAAAAAPTSVWDIKSPTGFATQAWKAMPGWAKALTFLAGAGLVGAPLYHEVMKRGDPGVDPGFKGIGLPRDLLAGVRDELGRAIPWASQLGALRAGFRQAYAPLYGIA